MSELAFAALGSLVGSLLVGLVMQTRLLARVKEFADYKESAEKQAAERKELFTILLDSNPLAIVFYADAGRIAYANAAARRLFFAEKPAEGQNFLRLVAEGPASFRAALLGATDEIVGFDIDGQRETYHFSRRILPFAGEPHTLLVVRSLTREVARHEIDVLKRVVRLISHEVNNSLAPVSSLVHSARQVLRSGERLERLDRVFDTIDERAKHLSGFIAGYAALAKLPRPQPKDVRWRDVLERLATLYPQARLNASAEARGHFDPAQLEQALINLLKNANEAGGLADEVELEVRPLDEGGTQLTVKDRGRGFSPEALESALLPFYTTKPEGSGVGLALVREIVDAHGGQLTLAPREGGGAVVTVTLPSKAKPLDSSTRARLTLTRG
jgi:nitrogen fixation/metabolism regulation signal transduction histidine kinase